MSGTFVRFSENYGNLVVKYDLRKMRPDGKDTLIKETIRTMGYVRSRKALVDAVERGIKYGLKTGELVKNADKTIMDYAWSGLEQSRLYPF